jgi:dTDP-4-dehydrorhamnose reductase
VTLETASSRTFSDEGLVVQASGPLIERMAVRRARVLSDERGRLNEIIRGDDQTSSPTETSIVARAPRRLLRERPKALSHLSGDGYVRRFGMATFVLGRLVTEVELSCSKSSDNANPAVRSLNSQFDRSKITALFYEPIGPWQGPRRPS